MHVEEAFSEALAGGGLHHVWAVVAPPAAAEATAAAAAAAAEETADLEAGGIQRVKDIQWRALTLAGSAFIATMIGAANLLSRLYYDVLRSGDSRLAVLLPAGAVALVLGMVLCCFTCYHRRSLVQAAKRLCAPRPCGMRWTRKTASQRAQPEEDATAASRSA